MLIFTKFPASLLLILCFFAIIETRGIGNDTRAARRTGIGGRASRSRDASSAKNTTLLAANETELTTAGSTTSEAVDGLQGQISPEPASRITTNSTDEESSVHSVRCTLTKFPHPHGSPQFTLSCF